MANKVLATAKFLEDSDNKLTAIDSAFLLYDTLCVANHFYTYKPEYGFLSDSAFDRLNEYIYTNKNWCHKRGITKEQLACVDKNTGFGLKMTNQQLRLFSIIVELMERDHANTQKTKTKKIKKIKKSKKTGNKRKLKRIFRTS